MQPKKQTNQWLQQEECEDVNQKNGENLSYVPIRIDLIWYRAGDNAQSKTVKK